MPAPLVVRRVAAVSGWLLAGTLTACSGTEGDPAPMPTVDGAPSASAPAPAEADVAAGLAALYAGPGATAATEREARCFGQVMAAAVPPPELADAGLLVDGEVVEEAPALPEPLARQWFAAQQACADFVEVSARAQVAATKGRLDRAAYAACLRRALSPAEIEAAVVATLTAAWDDPAVARLSQAQSTCAEEAVPAG